MLKMGKASNMPNAVNKNGLRSRFISSALQKIFTTSIYEQEAEKKEEKN
jgi:hypothetical protein